MPQVDYTTLPIRQYVDAMVTTQTLKAHMNGMINCKGAHGVSQRCLTFSMILITLRIEPMMKVLSAGWEK